MKGMKKLITMAMTLVMIFSFVAVAHAAPNTKITVENATIGETYALYKILDLEEEKDPNDPTKTLTYYYTTNASVNTLLMRSGYFDGTTRPDAAGRYYLTYKAGSVADIQQLIAGNLASFTKVAEKEAESTTVVFDGLEPGYYYITSTLGALVTITNANGNVTVKDKNFTIDIDKTDDQDTAQIGDKVNFTVPIHAPSYVADDNGNPKGGPAVQPSRTLRSAMK